MDLIESDASDLIKKGKDDALLFYFVLAFHETFIYLFV